MYWKYFGPTTNANCSPCVQLSKETWAVVIEENGLSVQYWRDSPFSSITTAPERQLIAAYAGQNLSISCLKPFVVTWYAWVHHPFFENNPLQKCTKMCKRAGPRLRVSHKKVLISVGKLHTLHPVIKTRGQWPNGHASTWSYNKAVEICHWLRGDDDIMHEKVKCWPIMVSGASPNPHGVDERYNWHVFSTVFLFPPSNHELFCLIVILSDIFYFIFGIRSLLVLTIFLPVKRLVVKIIFTSASIFRKMS